MALHNRIVHFNFLVNLNFQNLDGLEALLDFLESFGFHPTQWQDENDGPPAEVREKYQRVSFLSALSERVEPVELVQLFFGEEQNLRYRAPSKDAGWGSLIGDLALSSDHESFFFLDQLALLSKTEYGVAHRRRHNSVSTKDPALKRSSSFNSSGYGKTGPTPPGERTWYGPLSQKWLGSVDNCPFPWSSLGPDLLKIDCREDLWLEKPEESETHRKSLYDWLQEKVRFADYTRPRPLIKRPPGWPPE